MKRLLLPVLVSIFMLSCDSGTPKGVLPKPEMKAVLKDMHLADAYLSTLDPGDSSQQIATGYYRFIFKKHHTDLKAFEKSLRYYATNPVVLDSMYSQISAELRKEGRIRAKNTDPIMEQ